MASWKALLLFGLLAGVAVARAAEEAPAAAPASEAEDEEDYSEPDRAHLIVRKYFKDELGVQGRNLSVYIDVYNAGSATANEVQLQDAAVPAGLTLLSGALEAALGKIDVGSSVQHTYVVVPSVGSQAVEFEPATVTYVAEFDSKDKQKTTSSTPGIYVMTPVEQITRYALIAGSYASLGIATTPAHWRNLAIVAVLVAAVVGANTGAKRFTQQSTDRKRTKALAELEKEQ